MENFDTTNFVAYGYLVLDYKNQPWDSTSNEQYVQTLSQIDPVRLSWQDIIITGFVVWITTGMLTFHFTLCCLKTLNDIFTCHTEQLAHNFLWRTEKTFKNATWHWQWAHLVIRTCDKHYVRYETVENHVDSSNSMVLSSSMVLSVSSKTFPRVVLV